MIRASIDQNGYFLGTVECQESPLEPGVFLIPANSAPLPQIPLEADTTWRFVDDAWTLAPDYSFSPYYHKQTTALKWFQVGEEFDENYTDIPPIEGEKFQVFVNGEWVVDDIAKAEHQYQTQKQSRQFAYIQEADPLFFKWQRGEGTEEEWKSKVQEIKDRFPYG